MSIQINTLIDKIKFGLENSSIILSDYKITGKIEYNKKLARFTSWRVGGNGDIVFWPTDLKDLQNFLKIISDLEDDLKTIIPITFIGLGSNVLIRDKGIRGVIIITQGVLSKLEHQENKYIYAESGVPCAKIAKFMASNNYSKGEFLSGIPGTVGGALAMNAGAYKGETWNFVNRVLMIQKDGKLVLRDPNYFDVSYRTVKYNSKDKEWFAGCWFEFPKGIKETSINTIKELLKARNDSQPIGKFSGGSVFRNPEGDYAARIIDSLGLKGFCIGRAHVSEKHANFIINEKEALSKDIEDLILYIKNKVKKETNIDLIPEVHILGDE